MDLKCSGISVFAASHKKVAYEFLSTFVFGNQFYTLTLSLSRCVLEVQIAIHSRVQYSK